MDTILALREKRKNLWDAAKNFLDTVRDENGMVSAEDAGLPIGNTAPSSGSTNCMLPTARSASLPASALMAC